MFDLVLRALSSLASFAFPVFASYKALEHDDVTLIRPWLAYWVVIAIQMTFESYFGFFISAIPFYHLLRLLFMLWLVLPQFQGASQVYATHVAPFLREHERDIDRAIGKAHDNAKSLGVEYLSRLSQLVRQYVGKVLFGVDNREAPDVTESSEQSTRSEQQPDQDNEPDRGTSTAVSTSYADRLFSRFRVPAPLSNGLSNGSGAVGSGVASFGSVFSAASATIMQSLQRDKGSKSDRLEYINDQRTKLMELLSSLDEQSKAIEREGDDTHLSAKESSGSLGSKSPTPSELDFDVVKAEDGEEQLVEPKKKGWFW